MYYVKLRSLISKIHIALPCFQINFDVIEPLRVGTGQLWCAWRRRCLLYTDWVISRSRPRPLAPPPLRAPAARRRRVRYYGSRERGDEQVGGRERGRASYCGARIA